MDSVTVLSRICILQQHVLTSVPSSSFASLLLLFLSWNYSPENHFFTLVIVLAWIQFIILVFCKQKDCTSNVFSEHLWNFLSTHKKFLRSWWLLIIGRLESWNACLGDSIKEVSPWIPGKADGNQAEFTWNPNENQRIYHEFAFRRDLIF